MKTVDEEKVKKVRNELTLEDLVALSKNSEAKNIFICCLGLAEYNRVQNFITAKQV